MEKIFEQTFNYAIITPFKNYSPIKSGHFSTNTFFNDIDDICDIENRPNFLQTNDDNFKSIFLRYTPIEGKKKIKYFYNDTNVTEKLELFPANTNKILTLLFLIMLLSLFKS